MKNAYFNCGLLSKAGVLGSFLAIMIGFEVAGIHAYEGASFRTLTANELGLTYGGECYSCLSQPYCATAGYACRASGTVWTKGTGFPIVQVFCLAGAAKGYQGCNTITPMDCISVVTCTNATCTNCGVPSTEQKDTACNFIPFAPCGS